MILGNFDIDYIIKECKVDLAKDILEEMLKYKGFECADEMYQYYFPIKRINSTPLSFSNLPSLYNKNKNTNFVIETFKNKYITIEFLIKSVNGYPFICATKTGSQNILLYTTTYEGQQGNKENKPIFNWKITLDNLVLDWNLPKFCDLNLVYTRIPETKPKKKIEIFSKFIGGNYDPFNLRTKWSAFKKDDARRRIKL